MQSTKYITARLQTTTDILKSIIERINKIEKINYNKNMKQTTTPPIYPELSIEDWQNYRLQNISEIEKQSIRERERDSRKALYKNY